MGSGFRTGPAGGRAGSAEGRSAATRPDGGRTGAGAAGQRSGQAIETPRASA
jgi:hypothetical protein